MSKPCGIMWAMSRDIAPPTNLFAFDPAAFARWVDDLVKQRVADAIAAHVGVNEDGRVASPWMTIEEAASFLRTSREAIDALLTKGRLTRHKPGMPADTPRAKWKNHPTLILKEELLAYAAGRPTGPLGEAVSAIRERSKAA